WRAHVTFWKQQLAGAPALLELPTDRARPATQSYRGGSVSRQLDLAQTCALKALSLRLGVSDSVLLLASIHALLHRYSRQDDIVVGVCSDAHRPNQFKQTMGNFANLLPLRAQVDGQRPFADLAAQLAQTREAVSCHEEFPFQALVEEL